MSELGWLWPLLGGVLLGGLFYGGLWWTVRRALASRHLALWLGVSAVLRLAGLLAGLYWLCGDAWLNWLVALGGIGLARLGVTRLTRPRPSPQESPHAY
ncbi:ATP synthase subunit I [Pseudaeromonas sp. ZJS20]|uniref:N-ATPase subunit AtpR n=1 Tax=Pseudaeromonas aegiceratis TaxID=3153928 RepID=UPI00390CD0A5